MKNSAVEVASFSVIKHAVAEQFKRMQDKPLFRISLSSEGSPEQRAAATGDKLWEAYLAAFPEGTNPIYKERTDHDCHCCKSFIRQMGGVVAIVDGSLESIWAGSATGTFYDAIMLSMAELVESTPIDNLFFHTERSVGTEKSFQQVVDLEARDAKHRPTGFVTGVITWDHFHLHLPTSIFLAKESIGPKLSDTKAAHDVLKRGLEELTLDSVDTILELVAQNSLYRGEESKRALEEFRRLKVAWEVVLDRIANPLVGVGTVQRAEDIFIWSNIGSFAARIRNTAIGTLLIDLSAGTGIEDAVKKFETSVMAPANYKRPTALVTKAMIEKARATVEELGYTSALERRYAHIDDITINNILFADRSHKRLSTNPFDDLSSKVAEKPKNYDKVEEVAIDDFLHNVLPKANQLEVMVENKHAGNFVSLIAPADPGAKNMFKWPNNFSWSYAGEVTDSIKERVKKAGGSVVGDLCCRLAWDYTDDLDFHMQEPGLSGGMYVNHVFYGIVRQRSANGGMLDVDANGCDGMKTDPVENIFYASKETMREGVYTLYVNNYARSSNGVGFEAEIEFAGQKFNFVYDKAMRTDEKVVVAKINYSRANGFTVVSQLASTQTSKPIWGVTTQTFRKVNVVMYSPNYWWNEVSDTMSTRPTYLTGNKHFFFMLDGCRNEDKARGFFNEFLSSELEPHRKTMEMVGAKMRTEESERQLSGLGFSSTQRNSLLVKVTGTFSRIVKVVF